MKILAALFVASLLLLGCLGFGGTPSPTPVAATPTPEATAAPTAVATATPSPAPDAMADAVEADKVDILYNSFSPAKIKVKAGTKVTWENQDGRFHSVKAKSDAPAQFNSYNIAGRQSWSYTFSIRGTYEYTDDFTGVTGTVYVV